MAWLLLISQLPARPAYLRVKLWRRLREIGAVPLKNAVHALPDTPASREAFHRLAREIVTGGGTSMVSQSSFDGRTHAEVKGLFQAAREADYHALDKDLRALVRKCRRHKTRKPDMDLKLVKARRRLSQIVAQDFFAARGREAIETLITQLEHSHILRSAPAPGLDAATLKARIWVTRQNIYCDRIACAWLIRRFVDRDARFRFVADRPYRARRGELRFDMPDAEFTHQGDKCSFEVILDTVGRDDGALCAIAEIIHDLDIEDGKFGRPEAAGIGLAIAGICATNPADMDRIARGSELLDGVYARLGREK
jgi:hypothetical protein